MLKYVLATFVIFLCLLDQARSDENVYLTDCLLEPEECYFRELVGNVVYFERQSAELTEKAKERLVIQAQWLTEHRDAAITPVGFANEDDRTSDLCPEEIAKQRAIAVRDLFIAYGVSSKRFRTTAGRVSLCADNDDSCRLRFRSVVTTIHSGFCIEFGCNFTSK